MSFFAKRKLKRKVLKINMDSLKLDQPLTARQVLNLFAMSHGCQSLETAILQHSKLEDVPEDIRDLFVEFEQ